MTNTPMTDKELEQLLKAVPQATLPKGFADRLQAKLETAPASNVVSFPTRKSASPPSRRMWLSAIPLAASLAAGLYLGAIGDIPASLASSLVSDASEQLYGSGFEDTEAFVNGDLS
jgi:hypothetical protein